MNRPLDMYVCIFIDNMYGYDLGDVMFKPTLASDIQFRLTKEAALSSLLNISNAVRNILAPMCNINCMRRC